MMYCVLGGEIRSLDIDVDRVRGGYDLYKCIYMVCVCVCVFFVV